MSNVPGLCLTVVFAGIIAAVGAEAAMYKWTDENGQTVYSQTPPPSGVALELKKPPEPDPAEVDRAREALHKEIERSYDEAEERERVRGERSEKQQKDKARTKNCEIARNHLSTIKNLGRRRILTPDGEYVFLSEDEREAKINETRSNIEKYCD